MSLITFCPVCGSPGMAGEKLGPGETPYLRRVPFQPNLFS